MNRIQIIADLAERRLDAKKNVSNPTRMLELIKGDLEQMSDQELQWEYDKVTGATKRKGNSDAKDYNVSTLDHAITDAVTMLSRHDGSGTRVFDDSTITDLLMLEYEPAIAGRALALAIDGSYKIELGQNHRFTTQAAAVSTPMSLAEYRALGNPWFDMKQPA